MMGDAFMFGVFGRVIAAQAIADKHSPKIIAQNIVYNFRPATMINTVNGLFGCCEGNNETWIAIEVISGEQSVRNIINNAYNWLNTQAQTYCEQKKLHPVIGYAASMNLSVLAYAIAAIGAVPTAGATSAILPVAKVLDVLGTNVSVGMYLDVADMLGWTQDGQEGYVTVQLTAGGTLASFSTDPSKVSVDGGLFLADVDNFLYGEPKLSGVDYVEVQGEAGPLDVSFSIGMSGLEVSGEYNFDNSDP